MTSDADVKTESLLLELAERCEAATEPDTDLDAAIAETQGWPNTLKQPLAPRYTASLDAALTLVPEGWDWLRRDWATMDCVNVAALTDDKKWAEHISGSGKTPALALCAAALRARTHDTPKGYRDDV